MVLGSLVPVIGVRVSSGEGVGGSAACRLPVKEGFSLVFTRQPPIL